MFKKRLAALLMFAPMAMAGQGMYVRVNSYLPNTEVKILKSHCIDRVESIKVNQTGYIEAEFCLSNDLTLSVQQNGKEVMKYDIYVSFGGSTLSPQGVYYKDDKVIAATLYPHAGVLGTQDRVVISLAHTEKNWMKEKAADIENKPLNTVILPGSHDTGTQGINVQSEMTSDLDATLRRWIDFDPLKMQHLSNWSISQKLSITDQLNTGIRYLDLRLCKTKKGTLVTCHGLAGTSMETIINAIAAFTKQHTREIIILDINHVYGINADDVRKLAKLLLDKLDNKIASHNAFSPMSLVKDFWSHNKQIIVVINDSNAVKAWPDIFWRERWVNSPWPNKQTLAELEQSLYENLYKSRHHGVNRFFVLQAQETPSTKTIIDGFNPFKSNPDSLIKLTTVYKFGIETWLNEPNNKAQMQQNGNIIIEDFTNGIDLTEYAKRLN